MRVAIISDVHSNLQAFTAVLKDIEQFGIDSIVALGDIIGYGGNPAECLDLLENNAKIIRKVRGNHEQSALNFSAKGEIAKFLVNEEAWQGILYSFRLIGEKNVKKFVDWPETAVIEELGISLAHGAISNNHAWQYVRQVEGAELEARHSPTKICFLGHTHRPFLFCSGQNFFLHSLHHEQELNPGSRYIINVGSVGQPRDHCPLAAYGILQIDRDRKSFMLRRVNYDIAGAMQAIRQAKLPESLATFLLQLK